MDTIYKYLDPDRIDVLANGSIRASQVDLLNDPFEGFPDFSEFEEFLNEEAEAYLREPFSQPSLIVPHLGVAPSQRKDMKNEVRNAVAQFRRNIREAISLMVCFSETHNNLLMWSHYAKAHSGFVLGFNARHEFFSGPCFSAHHTSRLCQVEYSENRPIYPHPSKTGWTEENALPIFLRKSLDWSYEKEWRILVKPEACKSIGIKNHHECFLLEWPADLLTEIIIGPRMSLDDQAKILELRGTKYPRAELFIAELSPTKYDLDIRYFLSQNG